ncbi:Gfo/Idh/MocA family protein [Halogeometricum borinquense]|uniref:Gfo/Idh/MocA family protein n=1 Tax=Halogeometricum borinquense TaxID=60847 RepID=UPI00341481E5
MRRIAIVGREPAARGHAERYVRFEDATVCAAVGFDDPPSGTAIPTFESVSDAVTETEADAVDVCGPGSAHVQSVEAALDEEIPVRCDPPVALDTQTVERVEELASNGDGWLYAHSSHRFSRLYERLQRGVESGDIGTLGVARVKRTAPFDRVGWNDSYLGIDRASSPEDALCGVVSHDVDTLHWTFGPVERVFARRRTGDSYAHVHLLLRFRNGGRGTVEATWGRADPPESRVEVEYAGDHGRLRFTEDDASAALKDEHESLDPDPPEDDCRGRLLRAFVDRLHGVERPPAAIGSDGDLLRTAVAVRTSMDEERPVELGEVSR